MHEGCRSRGFLEGGGKGRESQAIEKNNLVDGRAGREGEERLTLCLCDS